jgi:hypothetical protein
MLYAPMMHRTVGKLLALVHSPLVRFTVSELLHGTVYRRLRRVKHRCLNDGITGAEMNQTAWTEIKQPAGSSHANVNLDFFVDSSSHANISGGISTSII